MIYEAIVVKSGEKGIAILESSFALVFLLSLVIAIASLVDIMMKGNELQAVLDRVVYDSGQAALKLNYGGATSTAVAHSTLHSRLEDMGDILESEISRVEPDLDFGRYTLEIGYSEIDIDPQTGVSNGYRAFPFSYSTTRGGLSLPVSVLQKTQVHAALAQWEQASGANGAHQYSTPTTQYGNTASVNRFLNTVLILSARVAVSLEGTFTGSSMEMIGMDPFIYSRKVILLRGDLSS